jgi:large subunit ribosomal protein L49
MSGGNRQVVLIKKVDGDRKKLLEDLVESLGVSKEDVRINPTTQHVELKVRACIC